MIDSTNPRILADNIRALSDKQIAEAAEILALQGGVEALGSYSTDESNTGMKWIDGSPIYRKVIQFEGGLPNATSKSVAHGISDLGYMIAMFGCGVSAAKSVVTIPLVSDGAAASSVTLYISGSNLYIRTGVDRSDYVDVYVVLLYTKAAAPSALTSPAPDDTRSIEPEEIREDEYIEPEVIKEAPEDDPNEEPIQEVKKTTRKKSTN